MRPRWRLIPDPAPKWPGLDPYSHWLLTHGADFVPSADRPKSGEAPILGVINRDTLLFGTKDGRFLSEVVNQADAGLDADPIEYAKAIAQKAVRSGDKSFEETSHLIFRLPMRRESLPTNRLPGGKRAPPAEWKLRFDPAGTQPVIVAVIDDVMNIAHSRLRDSSGATRVEFAWLQDADAVREPEGSAVPFGREWLGRDIDAVARKNGRHEERSLTALGLQNFATPDGTALDRRLSHGTHILDLAGGDAPGSTALDPMRLITVALPQAASRDTSGALLGYYVLTGLQYILARARIIQRAIGVPVPVVINFSYGITGGPHDGTHLIEELIAQAIAKEIESSGTQMPVKLVMPAGNTRLDRGHAMIRTDTAGPVTLDLPWRIQPGDSTSNYLEVWMPANGPSPEISLTMPDGEVLPSTTLALNAASLVTNANGLPIARISVDQPQANTGKRRLLIAAVPSAPERGAPKGRFAPSGVWQVRMSANVQAGGKLEAWIQRDAWPLRANAQTRQSYFDDPSYVRFAHTGAPLTTDPDTSVSVVRRKGTLNGLATGLGKAAPIVVAAGLGGSEAWADYSGLPDAETRAVFSKEPMIACLSERSRAVRGVLASGSRAGSVAALGGTSVAAPQATRHIALALMSGRLDPQDDTDAWLKVQANANGGILPKLRRTP